MSQSRRNVRDLMYLGFIIVPYPSMQLSMSSWLCAVESAAPLHCPSHKLGFSGDSWLDLGWLISVETKGCKHGHPCCFFSGSALLSLLSESRSLALFLPSLCPLEAYSCISLCYWVKCVFLCACVYICLCVCVLVYVCLCACVLEHIHQSPYLKPVVPAFLTCAAQSPNLIAHTPLYCTNLNATEKICIAFLSPLIPFHFSF